MKQKYEKPEMVIFEFAVSDILTTSLGDDLYGQQWNPNW